MVHALRYMGTSSFSKQEFANISVPVYCLYIDPPMLAVVLEASYRGNPRVRARTRLAAYREISWKIDRW